MTARERFMVGLGAFIVGWSILLFVWGVLWGFGNKPVGSTKSREANSPERAGS